jgi:hypothetical protein
MALPQKLVLPFAVVAIFASSVLVTPAHVATQPVVAPIPEPLPLPCSKQHWTNADRICLTWTAPRDEPRHTTTAATGNGSPVMQGG